MLVYQKMTPNPLTVQAVDFASTALNIITQHRIRHLIVLNGYTVIGVLSINDFPQFVKPQLAVMDIMTVQNVVTIQENEPVSNAATLLANYKIGYLPVLSGSRLVGIITISDIF
jgi:acetoin utilization protein AcuB